MRSYRNRLICFLFATILVLFAYIPAYAQEAALPLANDDLLAEAPTNGYDPQTLSLTRFPDVEQTGQNILKIWGGPYLTVEDQIYFSYTNPTDHTIAITYDYALEVEIDGNWYEILRHGIQIAVGFGLVAEGNFLYAVGEDIRPELHPGKHRIVLYSGVYGEFEIVESGSSLVRKPQSYDQQFLRPTPSPYIKDELTGEITRAIVGQDGLDIIMIEDDLITTTDEYIKFTLNIDTDDVAYWDEFCLDARIDGQWYMLSYYMYDHGSYLAGYPYPELYSAPYPHLITLDGFYPYTYWVPTGPFTGKHRLWGKLRLGDGTTVLAYGEFEIVDAADAGINTASAWAQETIPSAISAGLVPPNLQVKYQQPITRAEFAALAVKFLENKTGLSADMLLSQKSIVAEEGVFSDTDYYPVLAAYALGIVTGKDDGTFDPHGNITREQMAAMLMSTQAVLNDNIEPSTPADYADKDQFSAWAVPGINLVTEQDIMTGVGNNCFDPKGNCTREQAIVTFFRMLNE